MKALRSTRILLLSCAGALLTPSTAVGRPNVSRRLLFSTPFCAPWHHRCTSLQGQVALLRVVSVLSCCFGGELQSLICMDFRFEEPRFGSFCHQIHLLVRLCATLLLHVSPLHALTSTVYSPHPTPISPLSFTLYTPHFLFLYSENCDSSTFSLSLSLLSSLSQHDSAHMRTQQILMFAHLRHIHASSQQHLPNRLSNFLPPTHPPTPLTRRRSASRTEQHEPVCEQNRQPCN